MFKFLNDKGFTLIELLVAVSIFVTVIVIISGLFVQAIQGQRRNLAYQELLDQTSYVMEYMSRSIRMAMKDDIAIWEFDDTIDCLSGNKVNYEYTNQCLIFRNYKNECQFFCLEGTTLTAAITATGGGPIPPPSTTHLTSPELEVYSLWGAGTPWVNLSGQGQEDNLQPLVIIGLEIEGRENTSIRIQTSISQRNLDVEK